MGRGRNASKENWDIEQRNDDEDLHGADVEAICYVKVIPNCPYDHEEAASQRREPVTLFWHTSDMK